MYLAFAQHVNERQRALRGLGAFRPNERIRYLRGLGQDIWAGTPWETSIPLPESQIPLDTSTGEPITFITPTGVQVLPTTGAPIFSQAWMESQMIPGVPNSYLVLGVAGVFFVSALKKKKR